MFKFLTHNNPIRVGLKSLCLFNTVVVPYTIVKVDPGLARNPLQKGIKTSDRLDNQSECRSDKIIFTFIII